MTSPHQDLDHGVEPLPAARASARGWSFESFLHVSLGGAVVLAAAAVWIDPARGGSDLDRAQLLIARVGLAVGALGLLGIWLLRRPLARDLQAIVARWQAAPASLAATRLIPESGSRRTTGILWGLLGAWALLLTWALATAQPWIQPLTDENGVTETATVIGYLLAAGLAVDAARRCFGAHGVGGGRRWILIGLAVFSVLVAGEETDWGQTYLRYETPKSIEIANIQGDFSLHNLAPPEAVPGTRWANWALRFIGWTLGGVLPLLLVASAGFRRLIYAVDVPIPPAWSMAVLFLAACLPEFEGIYRRNNIGSELREFSIGIAVAVWLWAVWRQRPGAAQAPEEWSRA